MSDQNTNTPMQAGHLAAFPPAPGSPAWQVGDSALIATYTDFNWCEIIEIGTGGATVMMENGNIRYYSLGSLETRESCLRACERMQDEWTGAQYRRMVEMAKRPFVKPPQWGEWMARAKGEIV